MVKLKKTMKKIGKIFSLFFAGGCAGKYTCTSFLQKTRWRIVQKICSRQNLLLRRQGQKESAVSMITKKHFCGGFE